MALCMLVWDQAVGSPVAVDGDIYDVMQKYAKEHFVKSKKYELVIKEVLSSDFAGGEFRALVTYCSQENPNVSLDVFLTLRRKSGSIEVIEDIILLGGCSTTDVAEVRVAIREQVRPSGLMFLTCIKKKADGLYGATYVTDRHPLGGAGADVELARSKDKRKLEVIKVEVFKR